MEVNKLTPQLAPNEGTAAPTERESLNDWVLVEKSPDDKLPTQIPAPTHEKNAETSTALATVPNAY